MKILLVQANKPEERELVFPLGLAYLAGNLRKLGCELKGFDSPLYQEDYKEELKKSILNFCPDIIGISVRNLDNQRYSSPVSFLPETKEIVEICQDTSRAKIVVGGSGFSIAPQQLLDYLGLDFGIIGEGEEAFAEQIQALEQERDFETIPGVVRRFEGKTKMLKPLRIKELDSLELPDREIFELWKYRQQGTVLNVRTKRGCPFRCIYCTTPQIEGSKMRLVTPRRAVDELEMLKKNYKVGEFYFTDNIFNYPATHAESICEEIISRKLNIKWYCIANPCTLSKDLLKLMKQAGCSGFTLGIESASPQMLRNLRKNFTLDQVRQSCLYCQELGISYHCSILLGGPGESRGTIEETVSVMEELKPESLSITVGIRIYPNTELDQIARNEGIFDIKRNLLTPTFYLPREIKDWVFDYIKEVGQRNGWTVPILS